jgi:hypothetical protein
MRFKSRNVDDRSAARPGFIVAGKELAACFDAASHSAGKPVALSRACGTGASVIPPRTAARRMECAQLAGAFPVCLIAPNIRQTPPRLCGSTQSLVAADSEIGAPAS